MKDKRKSQFFYVIMTAFLGIYVWVLLDSPRGFYAQEGEAISYRPATLATPTPKPSSHLSTSRVAPVWQKGIDGAGEKIAILEGANIDPDVSCLNIIATRSSNRGIGDGHKTRVASVAACDDPNYKGVAYQADLVDAGYDGTQTEALLALQWAIKDQGAHIVNMSAGAQDDNQMHKYDKAFDYWARKEKATIIKSAGNRNNSDNITSPGKGWNVITVGALDENGTAHWADDGIRFRSSFEDPVVDDDPPGDREKPEMVAPGQDIVMIDQGGTPVMRPQNGTSYAAPQVAGLVALLMARNNRLRDKPNVVKAILLASAVHNVEGDRRLSEQDGVGGINAVLADHMARYPFAASYTICNRPCWWQQKTAPSTPSKGSSFSRYFRAAQGERIRIAISWFSAASGPPDYTEDELETNFNLYVYNPSGGEVARSNSKYNNYEIVEFVAPETGKYKIRILRSWTNDQNEASNSVGIAWSKQATYLPDVRANIEGWQSTLYVRNDGATPVTPIVTFYDSNGTAYGPHNPANALAPNAVWEFPLNTGQFQGSAIVSGVEDLSVVVVHRHANPDKIAAYTGVHHPTSKVPVPLLLRNVFGIDSTLAIHNTGHSATDVKVLFTPHPKEDGPAEGRACTQTYTVAANGVQNIDLSGLSCLGSLFVGSAQVTNSQNQPLAMATTQEEDTTMTAASNLHPGSSILYAPLIQYHQPGRWEIFSSGSVQDTSGSTSTITTRYYNVDGSECTGNPWSNNHLGGHQMVNTIPMPPDGNGCTNVVVAAKIDGAGKNKVAQINQRRDKSVSTYEAMGQGSQAMSIPYVHNTGHWDTGISMQNLANEATEVTIKYYNTDGSHHSTRRVDLAAQGRTTYDWGKPTPEFSGSAVVIASNPIAVTVNVLDYRYAKGQADGLISYSPIPR